MSMKNTYCPATLTATLAFTLSIGAQAAPNPQTQISLQEMDSSSAAIAMTADKMELTATPFSDPDEQQEGLDLLRQDMNEIGRDLRTLEAERQALPEWESQALDRVSPQLKEIARNVERSIAQFNYARNHLWTTSYRENLAAIADQAKEINHALTGYLKLASARRLDLVSAR
jgi:hypothetical protein